MLVTKVELTQKNQLPSGAEKPDYSYKSFPPHKRISYMRYTFWGNHRTYIDQSYHHLHFLTAPGMLVGASQRKQKSPQAHGSTIVALHPVVFRVSYFHEERRCKQSLSYFTQENKLKGNFGSEVLIRAETLSEDNFATTDSLRAPVNAGLPSVAGLQLYAVSKHGGL